MIVEGLTALGRSRLGGCTVVAQYSSKLTVAKVHGLRTETDAWRRGDVFPCPVGNEVIAIGHPAVPLIHAEWHFGAMG